MTIRLVIADDHPVVLEGIARLLEREPDLDLVAQCGNGEDALEAVRRHQPDVLLLDLRMPELDGMDVLRRAAREGLSARTVLLTIGGRDEELLEAIQLGVRGVLLKDVAPELLIRSIRTVHAGGQWLEQELTGRALQRRLAREAGQQKVARLLSRRETEIVDLVCQGLRNKEVAARLGITEGTVKIHLYRIYERLGVGSRVELANSMRQALN